MYARKRLLLLCVLWGTDLRSRMVGYVSGLALKDDGPQGGYLCIPLGSFTRCGNEESVEVEANTF